MTEKRFTYEYDDYNGNLFDNKMNTFYHIEDSDENIEILCNRLNCLVEENEQLKQGLEELKEIGDYQADRIKELQEFEDKVFDSLNDKIKKGEKAIEWGESIGADVGAMGFHVESLKQFKKELEE